MSFSDKLFSTPIHANLYTQFRPVLPQNVVNYVLDYLKKYIPPNEWDIAVDVGCGGGQSTTSVAKYFKTVYGFDVSSAQIKEALESDHPKNVYFGVSKAESISTINSNSIQLLMSCTAVHWFDLKEFFIEANRVLVSNGLVALIGRTMYEPYDPNRPNDPYLAQLLSRLRSDPLLLPHKPTKKSIIENKYRDIVFPESFDYIYKDNIIDEVDITAEDILGYMKTSSNFQQLFKSSESKAKEFLNKSEQSFKDILKINDLKQKQLIGIYRYFVAIGRKIR